MTLHYMAGQSSPLEIGRMDMERHMKIQYLLNNKATRFLRQQFLTFWSSRNGNDWENGSTFGLEFIKGIGESVYNKSQKLQRKCLESGNVSMWDVPLLANVLKSILPENKIFTNHLDTVKGVRNELSHMGTMELDEVKFDELWGKASGSLQSIGMSKDEIEMAKNINFSSIQEDSKQLVNEIGSYRMPNAIFKQYEEIKKKGNEYFGNEKYVQAVSWYTQGMDLPGLDGNSLSALYANRSAANLKLGYYDDARDDAKSCITLRPNWFRGYVRLGNAYNSLKSYKKGLKYMEMALTFEPRRTEVIEARDGLRHTIAKLKREEHLDPLKQVLTREDINKRLQLQGMELMPGADFSQKANFMAGLPSGTCGEAHKYLHGMDGYTQNYERAASLFAKAAMEGNAEGMYNLAVLTKEGTGVKRDIQQSHRLMMKAASQPYVIEIIPGCGVKIRNLGVAEAQHSIGLSYEEGVGVPIDIQEAIKWYSKALENGSGFSANNLGLIYSRRMDFDKAVLYWKVGSLLDTVRAMENLALNLLHFGKHDAKKWFMFAVHNGSISLSLRAEEFNVTEAEQQQFDNTKFREELRIELLNSPLRHIVVPKDYDYNQLFGNCTEKVSAVRNPKSEDYEKDLIVMHRTLLKFVKSGKAKYESGVAKIVPKVMIDLIGLQPITFSDMDLKLDDKVYDGRVLRHIMVIEDAILKNEPSAIQLLAKDEDGTVRRIFVYNYQTRKTAQDEIGYGCKISIVNPYFRKMKDHGFGIRVDDSNTIFQHSQVTDKQRCRYCGGEGIGTVICRKCRRVYYCSRNCMKKDMEELEHDLVCFKKL